MHNGACSFVTTVVKFAQKVKMEIEMNNGNTNKVLESLSEVNPSPTERGSDQVEIELENVDNHELMVENLGPIRSDQVEVELEKEMEIKVLRKNVSGTV
jgi:hypothetical protein